MKVLEKKLKEQRLLGNAEKAKKGRLSRARGRHRSTVGKILKTSDIIGAKGSEEAAAAARATRKNRGGREI